MKLTSMVCCKQRIQLLCYKIYMNQMINLIGSLLDV